MRVISFKVWGDFAHFRRHYTTSSPLTLSIFPPSALRGFVGGILGLDRKRYPEILSADNSLFGVRLLSPVKKIRLGLNYLDTKDGGWVQLDKRTLLPVIKKDGHGNPRLHTQVRVEFLKNPVFEIFFHHEDVGVMNELSNRLKEKRCVYTPFLGITECIANFSFLWDMEVSECSDGYVISAFPLEDLESIKVEEGVVLIKEKVPVFIDHGRIRKIAKDVAFNPFAEPLPVKLKKAYRYPESEFCFAFIG